MDFAWYCKDILYNEFCNTMFFMPVYTLLKRCHLFGLYCRAVKLIRGLLGCIYGSMMNKQDIQTHYTFSCLAPKFSDAVDASKQERGPPQTFFAKQIDNNKFKLHEPGIYIHTFSKWVSFK